MRIKGHNSNFRLGKKKKKISGFIVLTRNDISKGDHMQSEQEKLINDLSKAKHMYLNYWAIINRKENGTCSFNCGIANIK